MHHARNGFLTKRGLAEAAQRERESLELAGVVAMRYLDKVASVSGLVDVDVKPELVQTNESPEEILNGK